MHPLHKHPCLLPALLLGYLIRCEAFQQERAEEGQDNGEKFLELMKEEDPQIQEVLQVLRMGNQSNYTLFIRW